MDQNIEPKKLELDHDKLWAVFAYIFFPLPLLLARNKSQFLIFHINQGIIFAIIALIGLYGLDLPSMPFYVKILSFIKWVWYFFTLSLLIKGIQNVLNRRTRVLPVVGKLFTFLK